MRETASHRGRLGEGSRDLRSTRDERPARNSEVEWVRLALPVCLVRQLMESRYLCIADVRCLDAHAKEQLRRLCLECCIRCLSRPALPGIDTLGVVQPSTTACAASREVPSRFQSSPQRV